MERTRIAPTPSGFLHAGNGVSFLLTAKLAQRMNATLRLRIDDLDHERARTNYIDDLFESLRWLGIVPDEGPRSRSELEFEHSQMKRVARYEEYIGLLKEQGDLYACTCSRAVLKELQRKGRRSCECRQKGRSFTDPDASWRLHLPSDAVVRMEQLMGGTALLNPAELMPDPVIEQRASLGGGAKPAYQIASLIDDADHGITFIVRGEDLLPSTACQLYLADRLGLESFKRIRFVHHPLITDVNGKKLSKSEGA
ncbi:MAG TPA: glutamate--tRNA ligase family protein, partial [Flavobacteriales bacterium]|nr:glutamate--tRNA ligase family protein [Flavobacteriales bacterium]